MTNQLLIIIAHIWVAALVARGHTRLFGVCRGFESAWYRECFAVRQQRLHFLNSCLWCYHPCVVFLFFFELLIFSRLNCDCYLITDELPAW